MKFCVYVKPTKFSEQTKLDFSLTDVSDETKLTYDDVEMEGFKKIEDEFPDEFHPELEVTSFFIYDEEDDKKMYPVVSESDKKTISKLKKCKSYEKFLILPDAVYRLTPACLLAMELESSGLVENALEKGMDVYQKIIDKFESYFKIKIS